MKLGINNGIWEIGGISVYEALDRIADAGLKYVDIFALGSADPGKVRGAKRKELVRKFKSLGLVASNMVVLPVGNISSDQQTEKNRCLDHFKECTELQAELGGSQVLIGRGGGSLTLHLSRERAWANSVGFFREVCEWLSKMRMFLTLELEPFLFCVVNGTTPMARIIADVNMENLFANVDIGHLAITREAPVTLEKLKGRILHVHISDNNGIVHGNFIIGRGVTRVADYMSKLIEMGVDGTCANCGEVAVAALELGVLGEDVKDPDGYVKESLEYVNRQVPELTR